jgi:hypothetical protein
VTRSAAGAVELQLRALARSRFFCQGMSRTGNIKTRVVPPTAAPATVFRGLVASCHIWDNKVHWR